WDAGVMFEETTGTLLCGDLFTQVGNGPPITDGDIVGPSIGTEDLFRYTSLGPTTGPTIRKLADLNRGRRVCGKEGRTASILSFPAAVRFRPASDKLGATAADFLGLLRTDSVIVS